MLCKKCYQAQGRIELEDRHPWDHCHHEEENKMKPISELKNLCPSAWEPMKPKEGGGEMTLEGIEQYFIEHDPYPTTGSEGKERILWLIQQVRELEGAILGWRVVEKTLKERVKFLEADLQRAKNIEKWEDPAYVKFLEEKVGELSLEITRLENQGRMDIQNLTEDLHLARSSLRQEINLTREAETRVKILEEGIEKHKSNLGRTSIYSDQADTELYKLIRKGESK